MKNSNPDEKGLRSITLLEGVIDYHIEKKKFSFKLRYEKQAVFFQSVLGVCFVMCGGVYLESLLLEPPLDLRLQTVLGRHLTSCGEVETFSTEGHPVDLGKKLRVCKLLNAVHSGVRCGVVGV